MTKLGPFGATVWAQGRRHVKLCPLRRRSRRGRSNLHPPLSPVGRGSYGLFLVVGLCSRQTRYLTAE
jgi:hypothetical protein